MTDTVGTTIWLRVEGHKSRFGIWEIGHVAVFKNKPSTKANEIAVKIVLAVPSALFERPVLETRIEVPGDGITPPVVTSEMADNLSQILSEQLGLRVHVSAEPPEESSHDPSI